MRRILDSARIPRPEEADVAQLLRAAAEVASTLWGMANSKARGDRVIVRAYHNGHPSLARG